MNRLWEFLSCGLNHKTHWPDFRLYIKLTYGKCVMNMSSEDLYFPLDYEMDSIKLLAGKNHVGLTYYKKASFFAIKLPRALIA